MDGQTFASLVPGDIVRHKMSSESMVVMANYGNRITVARTSEMTNPLEWDKINADEIHRLEARIAELKRLVPVCDEHGTGHGARSGCPYCALIQQSIVLSQISYLCDEPNEQQVSAYDVHCDEDAVLATVKTKLAKLEAAQRLRDALDGQVDGIADAIDAFDAVVKK